VRAAAAVTCSLLQIKNVGTNPDETWAERQMLRHGGINVKYLAAVVVRCGVLGVDVVADVGAELKAVLLTKIADQHARFEGPVAQPPVGQPVLLELALRRVDAAEEIHMQVIAQRAPTRIPVYVVVEKVATGEAAARLVAAMKFVVTLECFDFR
jgi:hypothetical protein